VDDVAVTALLHRYGALSFWDYATGASYLDMNMNPTTSGTGGNNNNDNSSSTIADASLLSKDAIFFSGHKLLGGVGTPGVLIIKKKIVSSTNPPERCGGGTVFYVTDDHHRFLSNKVERYEGGTPDVVGIWRLGLVFKLKQALKQKIRTALLADKEKQQRSSTKNDGRLVSTSGDDVISSQLPTSLMGFDIWRAHSIQQRLKDIPNIVLVDGKSTDAGTPKLPIFSFLIVCGSRFLHYNYVCAVLNDLFGIQSRGGCQCAGPYAQLLLGMEKTNDQVEQCLVRTKDELLRPGVTRLSLPTIGTTKELEDYVIEAIRWVATNGWKLLHVYRCNHRSGEWRHKSRPGSPLGIHERLWLSHYQLFDTLRPSLATGGVTNIAEWSIEQAMQNADKMLELAINDQPNISQALKMVDEDDDSSSALRWYVYPKDVARSLRDGLDSVQTADDGSRFLGALNPLVLRVDSDIKRLLNAPEDLPTIQPKKHLDRTAIVHFRDGEHTGDAPLEEVLEGFGSGELSADCMVYDTRTDRWKPISSFVTEPEPQGHTTPDRQDSNDETLTAETFDAVPCDNALAQQVVDIDVDVDDELPLMEKNDKKRPARDSKSWGVGLVQVPGSIPSVNGGAIDIETTRSKSRHVKPPAKLMRQVTQAMIQWDMLQDGDRLLLGLSGGKDSLSLLHILLEFQKKLPIKFDIEVSLTDCLLCALRPQIHSPKNTCLPCENHYFHFRSAQLIP
jgi:selenocysteine lyase/cysteine desulfurase